MEHALLFLLLIGYLTFTLDKKQTYFPVPVILVIIGLGLSVFSLFNDLTITEGILFKGFLPALLFVSAYRFSVSSLKKHAGMITLLSTIGLLATAFLLGVAIHLLSTPFMTLTILEGLLIASILTPTDPVSVVSILKQSSNDEAIADVVEGESMINDGTSIVLFSIFLGMYGQNESFSMTNFISEFFLVSAGGIAIGFALGWALSKAVHVTHHKEYQVMLSIVLAYGAFYIAEHLGVSGVLATVTTGILLSYEFSHTNKEDHYRESLDGFWDVVEPSLLSLLFLMIGIEAAGSVQWTYWSFAVVLFILALLVRFVVLYFSLNSNPNWRHQFQWQDSALLTWAGIKGTMSVALLLTVQAQLGERAEPLFSVTFIAVLLSLGLQSIGIYPLSKQLQRKKSR
ncbi:sodium:proton antiporter [Pontibacillus halophilus JSM 076056 = DSM 19796]|uniref:Sodium:proton antiporter n=1 Tax=Pontibacillus halophilus JSM 076056 = DSM 19796 TaxID=1385510 RepID=A0A0A5GML3_9BACI|nr:sodium:proton antiporter [Pontibacillus halophilus]KGX92463.1 sodium:proton antiporter [Pontibacillus halophilus JSM 076056 = DSM 19796]